MLEKAQLNISSFSTRSAQSSEAQRSARNKGENIVMGYERSLAQLADIISYVLAIKTNAA